MTMCDLRFASLDFLLDMDDYNQAHFDAFQDCKAFFNNLQGTQKAMRFFLSLSYELQYSVNTDKYLKRKLTSGLSGRVSI